MAEHPEVPATVIWRVGSDSEHALQGFDGVRAYCARAAESRSLLEHTLGFEPCADNEWLVRGEARSGVYAYDQPPNEPGASGPGTVHHVAFASATGDNEAWRRRLKRREGSLRR